MATTKEDIKGWYDRAKQQGSTHFFVVCDTFDYEGYPVFIEHTQDVRKEYDKYDNKNMQKVMEVYNMSLPLKEQVDKPRAFNF